MAQEVHPAGGPREARLRRSRGARFYPWALVATLGARAAAAQAEAEPQAARRVTIDDSASVLYNTDNRNTRPDKVASYIDDHWGLAYNRLNLQANWRDIRAGLRLDSFHYYTYPSPQWVGLEMLDSRPAGGTETDAEYFQSRTLAAAVPLAHRYIDWTYPAKYYAEFTSPNVEVSVGDFYSQLGRGFTLSVRKMDELASDTTVRGARVVLRTGARGGVSTEVTALGGGLNPLRVDEASGRYLGVTPEVTPGYLAATEALMPHAITSNYVTEHRATYAPDQVIGGQVRLGVPLMASVIPRLELGTQASHLLRQAALSSRDDATLSRDGRDTTTVSQSLELPSIASSANLYVEAASQRLRSSTVRDRNGYALYAAAGLYPKPVALSVEAKHYRRFSALRANVDTELAPEFQGIQYSSPPTALPVWADYEGGTYGVCTTGARAKLDVAVQDGFTAGGWVGRYASWSELAPNPYCDESTDHRSRAWDAALGAELAWDGHRSYASWTLGGRDDRMDTALPLAPVSTAGGALRTTRTNYREAYLRYDAVVYLSADYSLELQGWHRRREKPAVVAGGWNEGLHTTGLTFHEAFTVAAGFEYTTEPGFPTNYVNSSLTWRITSGSAVSVFVGQRRGAIRCVGGVCRNSPPFEGARLDATIRL